MGDISLQTSHAPLLSQPNLRAISGILHKEKGLPLKFGLGLGCLDLESNSENLLGIALRVGRGLEGKEMSELGSQGWGGGRDVQILTTTWLFKAFHSSEWINMSPVILRTQTKYLRFMKDFCNFSPKRCDRSNSNNCWVLWVWERLHAQHSWCWSVY